MIKKSKLLRETLLTEADGDADAGIQDNMEE